MNIDFFGHINNEWIRSFNGVLIVFYCRKKKHIYRTYKVYFICRPNFGWQFKQELVSLLHTQQRLKQKQTIRKHSHKILAMKKKKNHSAQNISSKYNKSLCNQPILSLSLSIHSFFHFYLWIRFNSILALLMYKFTRVPNWWIVS